MTMKTRLLLTILIVVVGFVLGIMLIRHPSVEIDKDQAIAIAKREMFHRGWTNLEVEDKNVRFDSGIWCITVWRIPAGPGTFNTVEISTNGRVIKIDLGL